MIKEIDAEAHPSQLGKVIEIMEYFEHVRKYRGTIKKTLKQLKLSSNKYYTWKKRLESGIQIQPKKRVRNTYLVLHVKTLKHHNGENTKTAFTVMPVG